ncbi:MAG: hypothetical protein QM831_32300 [Kofleriaceae bacterium]
MRTCLLAALVGCGGNWFPAEARSQFVADTTCQAPEVIYRPDRSRPGTDPGTFESYEMRGCGHDTIYKCQSLPTIDNASLIPSCEPTTWCIGEGCTLDDISVATRTFSRTNSCPIDRLHAAMTVNPERPPDDIGRDPERLALWTKTRDQRNAGVGYTRVEGCDVSTLYRCESHGWYEPQCEVSAFLTTR